MAREITQRQLRNESGEIMRELDRGESFIVTRNALRWVSCGRSAAASSCRPRWRSRHLPVWAMSTTSSSARTSVVLWIRTRRRGSGIRSSLVADGQRRPRGLLDTSW